jgi:hypothetical protein
MIHIGFTGTQTGMTSQQKDSLAFLLEEIQKEWKTRASAQFFHHGDCIGADAEAHEIAGRSGFRIIIHPPSNPQKRAWCSSDEDRRRVLPYLDRNRAIVDESILLIAAPKENQEILRSGTWSTVRWARKCSRTVQVLPVNTVITKEDAQYIQQKVCLTEMIRHATAGRQPGDIDLHEAIHVACAVDEGLLSYVPHETPDLSKPEYLVGALHDTVHKEVGRSRPAFAYRVKKTP